MATRRRTSRREHRSPSRNSSSSPRIIWRGAITFGPVHIPVMSYPETYRDDLLARIRSKVRAGRMHAPSEPAAADRPSAQVIDLVAQLKKSLRGGEAPVRAARRARHDRPHHRARGRHAA